MSYRGFYKIKNPKKYRGDHTNCVFRSLWERKFMKYCDENVNVLEWSSEEVRIPYISPLDNRRHTYFVDFFMKVRDRDNKIKTYLIEIKPKRQTEKPLLSEGKKITTSVKRQIMTFAINTSKWEAAKDYCENRGWEFVILTEKTLFGKNKKC
jgi:hypothetical protein